MGVVVGGVLLRVCLWMVGIVVLLMRLLTVAVQGGRGIWVILLIVRFQKCLLESSIPCESQRIAH